MNTFANTLASSDNKALALLENRVTTPLVEQLKVKLVFRFGTQL